MQGAYAYRFRPGDIGQGIINEQGFFRPQAMGVQHKLVGRCKRFAQAHLMGEIGFFKKHAERRQAAGFQQFLREGLVVQGVRITEQVKVIVIAQLLQQLQAGQGEVQQERIPGGSQLLPGHVFRGLCLEGVQELVRGDLTGFKLVEQLGHLELGIKVLEVGEPQVVKRLDGALVVDIEDDTTEVEDDVLNALHGAILQKNL